MDNTQHKHKPVSNYKIEPKERKQLVKGSWIEKTIADINEANLKVNNAMSKYNSLMKIREEVATTAREYLSGVKLDSFKDISYPNQQPEFTREYLMKGIEYELDQQEIAIKEAITNLTTLLEK